jgi:predicted transglutaminase-like cysteine proteinase
VARVHEFFNQRIQPGEDAENWGLDDYWTTPGELLGLGSGDSEDFALAKYFTLLALNIPPEQLRLVYVQPRAPARSATANPVQVVLAWYETRGRDPQILDASGAIQLASQRPDLQPIYSFNSQGAWDEAAKVMAAGQPGRLAIWEDTLRRARAEGFE